jgi:hypothetical protein
MYFIFSISTIIFLKCGRSAVAEKLRPFHHRKSEAANVHFNGPHIYGIPHLDGLHSDGLHFKGLHSDGLQNDGLHSDGLHFNRLHSDGLHFNGLHSDGLHFNGLHSDGLHIDGLHFDGLHINCLHFDGLYFYCLHFYDIYIYIYICNFVSHNLLSILVWPHLLYSFDYSNTFAWQSRNHVLPPVPAKIPRSLFALQLSRNFILASGIGEHKDTLHTTSPFGSF